PRRECAWATVVRVRRLPACAVAALPKRPTSRALGLDPGRIETAEPAPATPSGLGPEAHARELRYRALERARHQEGARAMLLAHTRDDQAETVLLALARGSGTRSLGAMAPVRNELWRPLLTISGNQTRQMCTALELPAWQDPTNAPDGPWRRADGGPLPRAAVRHEVLPALERAL